MARKSFNAKERDRLYKLYAGKCYLCDGQIDRETQRFEIEHVIPFAISDDNSDDNLRLAHAKCHLAKTAKDLGVIAKVKRQAGNHDGSRVKKSALAAKDKQPKRLTKPLPPRKRDIFGRPVSEGARA